MATLDNFIDKIDLLIESLPNVMLDNMEISAMDSQALLQRRIQERGVGADDAPLRPYSPEYKKYKSKQGKSGNGFVNLTFDNRMLNNIGIVATSITPTTVNVIIRPKAKENQDKMESISYGRTPGIVADHDRKTKDGKSIRVSSYFQKGSQGRGKIMGLTKTETELVKKVFQQNVTESIKDILL